MNNKRIIIIVLLIVVLISIMMILGHHKSIAEKIRIGEEKFGNEKCTGTSSDYNSFYGDSEHPIIGGDAITGWTCAICGKEGESSTTNTPKLCEDCAEITNRCETCGKLLK